jgi:hypothetical protein
MLGKPGLYFLYFLQNLDAALEFSSGLSREHHQMAPYSTSGPVLQQQNTLQHNHGNE